MQSGILPEMIKAASCTDEFLDVLLDLVQEVWSGGNDVPVSIPKEGTDAVPVSIPKEGA